MTDPERQRVAVLDTIEGSISYFGEAGAEPGRFAGPSGIATGPDGRVYVVDRGNNVQVFTVSGP
jgi:DNA-binding beta-propeller fold protein YncE